MRACGIAFIVVTLLFAAGAGPGVLTDAEVAYAGGDFATARRIYDQCATDASDPGLVAFNLGAVHFKLGDTKTAAMNYQQTLDDAAIPTARRLQAMYNRGVCLLNDRSDAAALRTAIELFATVRDDAASDSALSADARFNLELAKLLWNKARTPNRPPPSAETTPETNPPPPEPNTQEPPAANTKTGERPPPESATPKLLPGEREIKPGETLKKSPKAGPGGLPVIVESSTVIPLSVADLDAYLEATRKRLDRERKANNRLRAGPERTHVRDW